MPSEDDVIITDVEKVKTTLNSLTVEMDSRYELLQKVDTRNIKEYNEKFIKRQLNPEDGHRFLPYIVVIVDEFADLIMVVGKDIEKPIARIAQKARAVGIHIILATQRPSADVITGVIKANFPARIAFKVSGMQDSRTIIDGSGAQNLIGRGDMLCQVDGSMVRVQCAFVSTEEVKAVSEYICSQQGYACAYELPDVEEAGEDTTSAVQNGGDTGKFDPMIRQVAEFVVENNMGSASNVQRNFSIGFMRAGRLMDQLARLGIVGPQKGAKPREVYVTDKEVLARILHDFGL
jgi:S-DNA-T family DNA segregation ATPase FtsK/SpoIIIE